MVAARDLEDREASPTAGVIDSQRVKTTESGGVRGYDTGKKIKERQRHIITDTLGLTGGLGALSAYDLGTISGDSGAFGRLELAVPVALPSLPAATGLGATLSPYGFAAAGVAERAEATALEEETDKATSIGLGLRLGLGERNTPRHGVLEVEYAHGTDTTLGNDDRINLQFQAHF